MVALPTTMALIVCKVLSHGGDVNSDYTGYRDLSWDTSGGVMHCRRMIVQQPEGMMCKGKGQLMAAFEYDRLHTRYQVWRSVCPIPRVDIKTGKIIAWELPSCTEAHRGKVVCENDIAI